MHCSWVGVDPPPPPPPPLPPPLPTVPTRTTRPHDTRVRTDCSRMSMGITELKGSPVNAQG
eukprot:2625583-Prymnesium_polylepis.1